MRMITLRCHTRGGKVNRRAHAHPPHQNINAVEYGDHERVVCWEGREREQPLREQSQKCVPMQRRMRALAAAGVGYAQELLFGFDALDDELRKGRSR